MAPSQPEYIEPRRPSPLLFDPDGNITGVRKLPYVKVAMQELDELPGDALRVLLLIRRVCDRDKTDGRIGEKALNALAVEHGIGRKRFNSALEFLERSAHVFRVPGSWVDAHFLQVCRSAHEREVRKEQWLRAKQRQRGGLSTDDGADVI